MNDIPIKYNNSLMKVKKSNKSRLNSLLLPWDRFMQNGLLISNEMRNGETCLEPFDPFAYIDLLVSAPSVEQDDSNILQIDKGLIQHLSSEDDKDSCNSEWDVIAQELWFVIFIDFLQSYFQNTLHWT